MVLGNSHIRLILLPRGAMTLSLRATALDYENRMQTVCVRVQGPMLTLFRQTLNTDFKLPTDILRESANSSGTEFTESFLRLVLTE